jgi:ABC-type transport system involved in multi-copper enzyme maturation permease subunit
MFEQLITVARNTFTESIRQPVYVVLVLMAALALILNPSLAANTFEDDNKLLVDMGLSVLFLAGLLLAAFTATGVLSAEIESKTVLTVVSKPVPRAMFVLGKFTGVAAAIAVAYWVLLIIFLLTVRHRVMTTASDLFDMPVILFGLGGGLLALILAGAGNYFYRWSFTSGFVRLLAVILTVAWGLVLVLNKEWQLQAPTVDLDGQLLLGLLLVFEAILIITAIAIAASTRLGQVMTLVLCTGAFLMGLISDSLFGKFVHDYPLSTASGLLDYLARAAMALIFHLTPNLQCLWPADALSQGNPFDATYIAAVSAYAVLYTAAVLALAIASFQTREVG